jgi:hypothetical protein
MTRLFIQSAKRDLLHGTSLVAAFAVAFFAYALVHLDSGQAKPVSDDLSQIRHVDSMDSWRGVFGPDTYGMFRPFKNLYFLMLGSEQNFHWHQVAVLPIILFSTILVFRLLAAVPLSPWAAFFGSQLWLWHPSNVSIFNWVSAANIAFGLPLAFAVLITAKSAINAPAERFYPYTFCSLLLFLLALLSYEIFLTLPAISLLYLYASQSSPFNNSQRRQLAHLTGGFAVVVVLFLLLRWQLQSVTAISANPLIYAAPPWLLSLSSSSAFAEHLFIWLWPHNNMGMLRSFDPAAHMHFSIFLWVLLLCTAALALRIRNRALIFGLFGGFAALFPVLNVLPIRAGPVNDVYLPLFSFCFILMLLKWLDQTRVSKLPLYAILAMWLGVCAFEAFQRQSAWFNENKLYTFLDNGRNSEFAAAKRSQLAYDSGDLKSAISHISNAINQRPSNPLFVEIFLQFLIEAGRPAHQLRQLADAALAAFPQNGAIWLISGDINQLAGSTDAARQAYATAAKLLPPESRFIAEQRLADLNQSLR